jgi:hypothetical protein
MLVQEFFDAKLYGYSSKVNVIAPGDEVTCMGYPGKERGQARPPRVPAVAPPALPRPRRALTCSSPAAQTHHREVSYGIEVQELEEAVAAQLAQAADGHAAHDKLNGKPGAAKKQKTLSRKSLAVNSARPSG